MFTIENSVLSTMSNDEIITMCKEQTQSSKTEYLESLNADTITKIWDNYLKDDSYISYRFSNVTGEIKTGYTKLKMFDFMKVFFDTESVTTFKAMVTILRYNLLLANSKQIEGSLEFMDSQKWAKKFGKAGAKILERHPEFKKCNNTALTIQLQIISNLLGCPVHIIRADLRWLLNSVTVAVKGNNDKAMTDSGVADLLYNVLKQGRSYNPETGKRTLAYNTSVKN